jgi:hypothetical protein
MGTRGLALKQSGADSDGPDTTDPTRSPPPSRAGTRRLAYPVDSSSPRLSPTENTELEPESRSNSGFSQTAALDACDEPTSV